MIKISWDDAKNTNDQLTASEWNAHVTDQKTRLQNISEDTTPELGGTLNAAGNDILSVKNVTASTLSGDGSGITNTYSHNLLDSMNAGNGVVGYNSTTDISFDNSTRTFTITPTSSSFEFYADNTKYISTSDSVVISSDIGLHFIYYNASGTLTSAITVWDLSNTVPVSTIYWTGSSSIVGDERHGTQMNYRTHEYLHNTIGMRYSSGLAGEFTASSATIGAGVYFDEDIKFTPTSTTQFRVLYRNGSTWNWQIPASKYFIESADVIQYDNSGTLTSVGTAGYVAYFFYATNDKDYPIWVITGQRTDNTLANARLNNSPENLELGTLPVAEMKLLYRVILQRSGTSENYIEALDYRAVSTVSGTNYVATDHGTLTGLTDDDHTQYDLANGTRTREYIQMNIGLSEPSTSEGQMWWSSEDKALTIDGVNNRLQVGQESYILGRNSTGSTLTEGTAVGFAGTLGASGRITIKPFLADGSEPSEYFIGVLTEDVVDGSDAFVTTFGKVRGIDTTGSDYGESWSDGDILYASPYTAGYLTNVAPTNGFNRITIAAVIYANSNGSLLVRPTHSDKLSGLQDVNIATSDYVDNYVMTYNSASSTYGLEQPDHSNLAGLTDDDHTQYVLADGSRAMTELKINNAISGVTTINGTGITNVQIDLPTSTTNLVGDTTTNTLSNKTFGDAILCAEIASPSTPASGKVAVYAKTDGKLYIKDDAGTETDLTSGTGGGSLSTLSDVSIATSDLVDGYVLTYEASSSSWISAASTGGSSGSGTDTFAFERTISGALFTGNDRCNWIIIPKAGTITAVQMAVKGQPTGASIIVDVNLQSVSGSDYGSGSTIFSTQTNRPTIAISDSYCLSATPDTTSVSAGDTLTIDIDQVGSTLTGQDLTIIIYGTYS